MPTPPSELRRCRAVSPGGACACASSGASSGYVREFRPIFAFLAAVFAGVAGHWIVCVGFCVLLALSADDIRYLWRTRLRPNPADTPGSTRNGSEE